MIIENFDSFIGKHCETNATGNLLKQLGIHLSEPLLFGLGEGLGFVYAQKNMAPPFMGGRIQPNSITRNICENLNLNLEILETSSTNKAWQNITQYIDNGQAVGLKLDAYHLDYFTNKIHFAAHYAAIYGYDNQNAYLLDTHPCGEKVKTSLKSLALARNVKGPLASKNLSYTISKKKNSYNLSDAIFTSIKNNCYAYLNPPIPDIHYKNILKAGTVLKKKFKSSKQVKYEFQNLAIMMEKSGTGGAMFRNLYSDFLKAGAKLLNNSVIAEAHYSFISIANSWTEVAHLLYMAGETKDIKYVYQAEKLMLDLSIKEKKTMLKLTNISKY